MTRSGANALAAFCLILLSTSPVLAKKKKAGSDATQPFSMIAGTVFRPPGFSQPGAKVRVISKPDPIAAAERIRMEAVTDARGEFAIRVPAVPMRYSVSVFMNGYLPAEKEVLIEGEQRKEMSFQLEAAK